MLRRHQQPRARAGGGLARGQITRLGGSLAEDAGTDLRGVFIGSEGTLGICTAITLRLLPQPQTG